MDFFMHILQEGFLQFQTDFDSVTNCQQNDVNKGMASGKKKWIAVFPLFHLFLLQNNLNGKFQTVVQT